jgi:formylglycine-generating enzyme required for sulfatase activity
MLAHMRPTNLNDLDDPLPWRERALDNREVLPPNLLLDGSYRIKRVVGSGGFGITYEAEDVKLGTVVAIKEYYPFAFGARTGAMGVRPKSSQHQSTFAWGRCNFLQEARTLARFEHPSIVRVTRVFESNSAAYMVMQFERGKSFEDWLKGLGRTPTQAELDRIVVPLLDALEMLHAANFVHRDIAPDNIIVRADGTPVLLDFGAARRAVGEMSQAPIGIVKAGYSPHEQYASDGSLQGPWSDLYALGGTLYRAVAGRAPVEATLRFDDDPMPRAADLGKGRFRTGFLLGIDSCLTVRQSKRPRSLAVVRPMLLAEEPHHGFIQRVGVLKLAGKLVRRPSAASQCRVRLRPDARRWPTLIAGIAAILAGAYCGYQYTNLQPMVRAIAAFQAMEQAAKGHAASATAARQRAAGDAARMDAQREGGEAGQAARRRVEPHADKQRRKAEAAVQAVLAVEGQRRAAIEAERARLSQKTFKDCDLCPDMVPVPGGKFLMGSSKEDVDSGAAADNEGPQRKVAIQELAVGRFEVTRDEFEAFARATGHNAGDTCWTLEFGEPKEREGRSFRNPGYAQLGMHPAVCVSWEDASAYVAWLSHITGRAYKLLSEAQWEYVARAGTSARYPWGKGEADLCAYGNGADQAASAAALPANGDYLSCNDGYVYTAPVGSFKANAFGVFDLIGNAWEWVEDCYAETLTATPRDGQAWASRRCPFRAVRGGSWSATPGMLRVTVRGKAPQSSRFDDVGFRVARVLAISP